MGRGLSGAEAASKGDYTILASTREPSDESATTWKLFTKDEIQSPADLKGKKLSTFRGTFVSYLWDVYLTENGVDPDGVELIGQGGMDEALVALKKGDVDAVWVSGTNLADKFKELEGVHELTDMSKTSVRISSSIIATNSLINDNGEAVKRLLQAIEEASVFASEHPEETADILFDKVKQPKEATLKDLWATNWQLGFSQASFDSLTKQKQYMVEEGIIETDFELNDKIDLDALKEVVPDRVTYTN